MRHASSLIYDVDNNIVEQFNSIISKFIGGKRINYCKKRSYQSRCAAAVVSHNTRTPIYTIRKRLAGGISPSKYAKRLELKRLAKKKNEKPKSRKKLTFLKPSTSKGDESYGETCQKPDMPPEEFLHAQRMFLENLKKTPEEVDELEELTRDQHISDLWYIERRKRLTASLFGVVCKKRTTTSCKSLLETILYPKRFYSDACEYGKKNEENARKELEKITRKTIDPCGLFVDIEQPFLAATPDGLIQDSGLVEIKCPYSARQMTPEEGIRTKKITFWQNNEINKNHKWYYQVQGQLHITRRSYCIFAVWTPHGLKTETILRDTEFWKNKMEPFLRSFYYDCMIPEIIDSRKARNMPIKDPEYILEAINDKKRNNKK